MYSTFIHKVHTEDLKISVDCIRNRKKSVIARCLDTTFIKFKYIILL